LAALRQQMEESNHEMVNMVTQQIGTIINPLIRETNTSYQMLSAQMERIANYFGAPLTRNTPVSQETNTLIEIPTERNTDQLTENRALRRTIPPLAQGEPERCQVLVNRRQDADQVVM